VTPASDSIFSEQLSSLTALADFSNDHAARWRHRRE